MDIDEVAHAVGISLRISGGTAGRPPRRLDFQRQYDPKPDVGASPQSHIGRSEK